MRELQGKFDAGRHTVLELREQLDERTKEIETIKKKHNRDASINSGLQDSMMRAPSAPSSPSKQDSSAHREEIRGLKWVMFGTCVR